MSMYKGLRHAIYDPSLLTISGLPLIHAFTSLQEFNIEKLQLLETEKGKVKKDYERRESQIEVKKKM